MKNKILKAITAVAAAGAMVTGIMLDSISSVPLVVFMVCIAWVMLFLIANAELAEKRWENGR